MTTEISTVPGLYYIENLISPEYSQQLFHYLDNEAKWSPITDSPNSRVVQHYGFLYNYKHRNHKEMGTPIPYLFSSLIQTLEQKVQELKLTDSSYSFNQVIVNNYEPGQGISKHTDIKSYGAVIGCYTIGSGATMRFRKKEEIVDIYVKPNSLYIMSGDARYLWTHEMPSTKTDICDGKRVTRDRRISITFRFVDE
jgi:alkylated DNA repair dioxygenase AlkB